MVPLAAVNKFNIIGSRLMATMGVARGIGDHDLVRI